MASKSYRRKRSSRKPRRPLKFDWTKWPDEEILELRFCDLGLKIEGSHLEEKIAAIYDELEANDLMFRPHFWLSNEWFCPDGIPGIAIPFYLAHPRLMKLEQNQMLEVEGGSDIWCMKILRHEVGHAIENAYRLRKGRKRQQVFGKSTQAYPEFYLPKPYSKSFVLHLDSWYAQSHPDEDFAETFAVWFTPGQDWRARYEGWPALRKIEFVDQLMTGLAGKKPPVRVKTQLDPIHKMRKRLKDHYAEKREHYGKNFPRFYDRDLRRLFSDLPQHVKNRSAASFIRAVRKEVRDLVGRWTGEYQYTINRFLDEMVRRCDELKLHLREKEARTKTDFMVLLTVQTMNYLHSGRHRIAL